MLLNDGGDATTIGAGATAFTMNTPMGAGAHYVISVGTQPYGIRLACTVSNADGTVTAEVNTVAINCAPASPTEKSIAWYF